MVHKYSLFGTNIVVDVNSGAVHVFDDLSFKILQDCENVDKQQILDNLSPEYGSSAVEEALGEIDELKAQGLLYSEDKYMDYAPLWNRKPVVKALCLHISHDCNMRCRYCFASTGSFGGKRMNMSPETGKKAIDFLIKNSGSRKNLEVDFFGGEPLLNFDAVKEVVSYAREQEKKFNKLFKFTITTNALLLNDKHIEFINENMQNVVLSIDGRMETNDRMRFRVDGSGTYKDILPKIKKIAEARNQDKYYVRGTFTRENLDFSEDVIHLADEGFRQISIEPVVAAAGTGYDIREEDLPKLFSEYEKLAKVYQERRNTDRWFNFFHFMLDLSQGPCIAKRLSGCGSGHEYMAVTPEGDLYPCHQFVGLPEFIIGNVDEGVTNASVGEKFRKSNVYTKNECRNCWARFYCSGGCAANAYQFNNDIGSSYRIGCELEKKRIECALWVKTQE